MSKTYLVTNIEYETDGYDVELPTELRIIVPDECSGDYEDIENYISEEISNITGYLHNGFSTTPEIK